jgi:hypothetical protein
MGNLPERVFDPVHQASSLKSEHRGPRGINEGNCIWEGTKCDKPAFGRGLCAMHYNRHLKMKRVIEAKHGEFDITPGTDRHAAYMEEMNRPARERSSAKDTICRFPDCDKLAKAHRMCANHYSKWLYRKKKREHEEAIYKAMLSKVPTGREAPPGRDLHFWLDFFSVEIETDPNLNKATVAYHYYQGDFDHEEPDQELIDTMEWEYRNED